MHIQFYFDKYLISLSIVIGKFSRIFSIKLYNKIQEVKEDDIQRAYKVYFENSKGLEVFAYVFANNMIEAFKKAQEQVIKNHGDSFYRMTKIEERF